MDSTTLQRYTSGKTGDPIIGPKVYKTDILYEDP